MIPSRVLCFELFGDYAQFRKFFANMSPLSFSIPPRTVLTGIIGAILGIAKNCNPEYFDYENTCAQTVGKIPSYKKFQPVPLADEIAKIPCTQL